MTTSFTFPLIEDPEPPEAPAPGVGDAQLAPATDRVGLGLGLVTPFRRDRQRDFNTAAGVQLVRSAIAQVIGIRADDGRMTGEIPWRPELGSLVHTLRFMNIDDVFGALARSRVVAAIARWEPRARVTDVVVRRVTNSDGHVSAVIRIYFDIVQAGTDNVMVRQQQLEVPLAA